MGLTEKQKADLLRTELATQLLDWTDETCVSRPVDIYSLSKIFHTLTLLHFSASSNFGRYSEQLACVVYDPDPTHSKLAIRLADTRAGSNEDPIPIIFISLRETRFKKLGLGNFAKAEADGAGEVKEVQAVTQALWRFRHQNRDTSLLMAQTFLDYLFMIEEESLRKRVGLTSCDISSMSETRVVIKEPNPVYETSVSMDITFPHSSTIRVESHVLKKFTFQFNPV